MGSEWKESTLESLSSDVSYGYTESASSEKVGPNFLRITDIQNGFVDWATVPYCPITVNDHLRYKLRDGDIVVARTGNSTGENYIFRGCADAVFASYLIRFRIDESKSHPKYVWYTMRSTQWWEFINGAKTGSAQAGANAKVLGRYPVPLPPLRDQKAIAHILGSLDDKIELNRRMNETLEGMTQALFKSWFVDFDPVIDNALVAGNPIPEELADRAEVRRAALANGTANREAAKPFPVAFQLTEELGWIPEGWDIQPLYNMANFINGASFKESDFSDAPDALPVVKIAEVKNGISGQTKFIRTQREDKYRIKDGEILLSWSGNPDTSIDTFLWTDGDGWLNQHIFKVALKDDSERCFVFYQLKTLRSVFAEIARDKQTTGLGHFTVADMKRLFVFKLDASLLAQFNNASEAIFNRYYENRLSQNALTKLRDTLLPKLISGELRIPDAEKLAESALA